MKRNHSDSTFRILLLILLIAGVMVWGWYAQKHISKTEITATTEEETTETAETETTASPSGDAAAVETEEVIQETTPNMANSEGEAEDIQSEKIEKEKVWKNVAVNEKEEELIVLRRVFHYPNEYDGTIGFEILYPEISGMQNTEYQNLLNDTIQQMELESGVGIHLYYSKIMNGRKKREFQGVDIYNNIPVRGRYVSNWFTIYGNLVSREWNSGNHSWHNAVYDIDTQKKVALDDILILDQRFWNILIKYKSQEKDFYSPVRRYYRDFIENFQNDEHEFEYFIKNETVEGHFLWYISSEGELRIHGIEYPDIGIPFSEFSDIITPKYQWLLDEQVPGYSISGLSYYEENKEIQTKNWEKISIEKMAFYPVKFSYGEYLDVAYFRVEGIADLKLQSAINDQILQKVINHAIDDIDYAYYANEYYDEYSVVPYEESVVHATSEVPSYYQNERILSFTNIEKLERKAYTSPEGEWKEAASRNPYFLAFNIDCVTGKELQFSDVFDADKIPHVGEEVEQAYFENVIVDFSNQYPSLCEDVYAYGINNILDSMIEHDEASESVREYHWFIDGEQNLCIYRRYSVDTEEEAFKIPLSLFKDAIKPEYQSCFHFD